MALKYNTNEYDIVESGSVILDISEGCTIEIGEERPVLSFTFQFDKKEGKEPFFETEKTGDSSLLIRCYNFNKGDCLGNTDLYRVGTLRGKDLYVKFRTTFVGSSNVILFHSWYKRK